MISTNDVVIEALLVRHPQHLAPHFPPGSGERLERFGPTINFWKVEKLDRVRGHAFQIGPTFAATHEAGSGHWTAEDLELTTD